MMIPDDDGIVIVKDSIASNQLRLLAQRRFGDMVKGVVDIKNSIMALGGDLHADEERVLLESGSAQEDLWGINIYPELPRDSWIEFDSMINLRPTQGNRSRGVDQPEIRDQIVKIVSKLVSQ